MVVSIIKFFKIFMIESIVKIAKKLIFLVCFIRNDFRLIRMRLLRFYDCRTEAFGADYLTFGKSL